MQEQLCVSGVVAIGRGERSVSPRSQTSQLTILAPKSKFSTPQRTRQTVIATSTSKISTTSLTNQAFHTLPQSIRLHIRQQHRYQSIMLRSLTRLLFVKDRHWIPRVPSSSNRRHILHRTLPLAQSRALYFLKHSGSVGNPVRMLEERKRKARWNFRHR